MDVHLCKQLGAFVVLHDSDQVIVGLYTFSFISDHVGVTGMCLHICVRVSETKRKLDSMVIIILVLFLF